MKPSDRPKFLEIVLGFAELKGKQLSVPALELFWRSMQHWTLAEFQAAAEQLVRTAKYFPTPSEFEEMRRAGRLTAGEAFGQVMDAVRSGMSLRELEELSQSVDPRVDAAVRACGGYRRFLMIETEKLAFLERDFTEHFETITDVEDTRAALPGLTGGSKILEFRPTDGPKRLGQL